MRIILLFTVLLAGCGLDRKPDIKFDFGHRTTSAITTAEEYLKLEGNWTGSCGRSVETTDSRYLSGQLCGDNSIEVSNYLIHFKFPASFFNHGVIREVSNCDGLTHWCKCEYDQGNTTCLTLVPKAGQCEISLEARLTNTVRETTSQGILGGPYSIDYITFDNANLQVRYLSAAVEQAEAPTDEVGGDHLLVTDERAAKFHCERIHKLLEAEIKKAKLEYSTYESSLSLRPKNGNSLILIKSP